MNSIAPYYKAGAAVVVPFLGSVIAAMQDASPGGSNITGSEWLGAVVLAIVSGGVVFGVPNRDPSGTHRDESVQPPPLAD
jgi:hypothetical protein